MNDTIGGIGEVGAAAVPDIVIAKYAPWPISLSFAATLAIFVAGWMALLGDTTLDHAWAADKAPIVMLLLCTLLTLWAAVKVLGQLIYHGGRAIWIENGTLRYTAYGSFPYSSMPLGDIQNLSIVRGFLRSTRIAIHTKDGGDLMATLFLSVPADVIRDRLLEALSHAGNRIGKTGPTNS